MNLGQMIGELRARAEAAEEGAAVAEEINRSRPPPSGKRQVELLALLADGRTVDARETADAMRITKEHAVMLLHAMAVKGLISRHGHVRSYRYTKLGCLRNP